MKKVLFVLLICLISISGYPQTGQFWKIAYDDMWSLSKSPRYNDGGFCNATINYSADHWYYPLLQSAGFTHIATPSANPELLPTTPPYIDNSSMHIIDFSLKQLVTAYNYASSAGNEIETDPLLKTFPYQVGGNGAPNLQSDNDNYGFGDNEINASNSAIWIYLHEEETQVGNKNFLDINVTPNVTVYKATLDGDPDPSRLFLKAVLPYDHQPQYKVDQNNNWRIYLKAKIDGSISNNDLVATVYINENTPSASSAKDMFNTHIVPRQGALSPSSLLSTWEIHANNFTNNNYQVLMSDPFSKTPGQATDLEIDIYWHNKRTMYIDQIAVASEDYKTLVIDNNSTARSQIQSDFSGYNSIASNSLFQHFYYDEPEPLMYRSITTVSSFGEGILGSTKYINGTTLGTYQQKMQVANTIRRPPYILYNYYPINEDYVYTSSNDNLSIQAAFDKWINSDITVGGTESTSPRGLKEAIAWAQNFTPDVTSDDIYLINTIQVHGERTINNGNAILNGNGLRPPSPNEIKCMGYLSLCYGSKGLMYYTINSNTPCTGNTTDVWANYGLFEESGNHVDSSKWNVVRPSPDFWVQNPSNAQIPNARFYAVSDLNHAILSIENVLLQLTWQNAYSIHLGQLSGTYISSVTTLDAANQRFVELGLYKNGGNIDYFMVVNRRTLSTESRNITVTFNKSSSYTTWRVTEVGSNNTWIVSKTGNFQTTYQPGEGKLFKFEPLFLNSSETFSNNVFVNSSVIVPSGKSLSF